MFLHFVPVDGACRVLLFRNFGAGKVCLYMFLCFQKTSLWTRPKAMSTGTICFTPKHKNIPFLPQKRYFWRPGWRSTVQGSRHTWTLKKHSFTHSFFTAAQLSNLHVGCFVGCRAGCCVVVMLLSLSSFTLLPCCQHRHHRHRLHAAAAVTAAG